jgi:hypothetical protein
MTITVADKILDKYNLSIEEFLILYICSKEYDIKELIDTIIAKGYADKNLYNPNTAIVSNNVKEIISSVIIDSDKAVIDKEEDYLKVAKKMQEIFPKGRKEGTTYAWRDCTAVIAKKLKTLVVKFDFKFTEEEALNATKKYVESFNGNYKFMQLLKYFILKNDTTTGDIKSEFMSLIENDDIELDNNLEFCDIR